MAGRGFSGSVLTELGQPRNQPNHLVALHLDSGVLRFTDAHRAILWGADTFTAVGAVLRIDAIVETADAQITELGATLSGVDQTLIAVVLAQPLIDRRMVIYKGFLNSSDALIADPGPIFDGRIFASGIDEDPESGSCVVSVRAASHWADFERRPGRHTNHEEQQLFFSGDLAFEFVSEINRQLYWGRPR